MDNRDLTLMAPGDAVEIVTELNDIDDLRKIADDFKVSYSGNTGAGTIKKNLITAIVAKADADAILREQAEENEPMKEPTLSSGSNDDEPIQVGKVQKSGPTILELLKMDAKWEEDPALRRMIIRAKAMRLKRVRITNLDPADSVLNGGLISILNKYTGKVAKYIPYGDESENGYHVPVILLDHLKEQQFVLRKEIKGGQFGVKKYKNTMVRKFAIEELPPLTLQEIEEMKARQRAANSIDKSALAR
jgi:hypothetical protein